MESAEKRKSDDEEGSQFKMVKMSVIYIYIYYIHIL